MGRLSPIPSLALENDWNNYASEFIGDEDNGIGEEAPNSILEDLAGTLADELTLQSDMFNQGSVFIINNYRRHKIIITLDCKLTKCFH